MDNHKVSDVTREKYEDAVVSVFMDQYAAALEASIDQEMDACQQNEFPEELDKRCMELIQKERAKKKRKVWSKQVMRVCRSAAIFAVALLAVCSVLFVSVEAFRIPVMNFFIEKTDQYMRLSGKENSSTVPESFDVNDPLGGIVPIEFVLTGLAGEWGSPLFWAEYSNEEDAVFSFEVLTSDGNTHIDSEDANVIPTKLLGHDAKITKEGNQIQISWLDENLQKIFTIGANNVSETTVISCAERIAAIFN